MIRAFILPVNLIDGTEHVSGETFIHDALLLSTPNPSLRRLIMDVTPSENDSLFAVCTSFSDATPNEIAILQSLYAPTLINPDQDRLKYLLSTSPQQLTMPIVREILTLLARLCNFIE